MLILNNAQIQILITLFFSPADSSSHEQKSHTAVATETRDVMTSAAGGRDDDSDVEIDLESVDEGDQLNSSDDKTEGKNFIIAGHAGLKVQAKAKIPKFETFPFRSRE